MTTLATRMAPLLPLRFGGWKMVERNFTVYRREWVVFLTGLLEPVFYLFSIGIGVAGLVGGFRLADGSVIGYTDDGEAAVQAVHARGLNPISSLVRRSTLEDVFLRLTGRSLVD
jgi:hypothetical protein